MQMRTLKCFQYGATVHVGNSAHCRTGNQWGKQLTNQQESGILNLLHQNCFILRETIKPDMLLYCQQNYITAQIMVMENV